MEIDTLGTGDDDYRINFSYPRNEGNPSRIILGLSDVRAADDLIITYDYDRDGYRIQVDRTTETPVGEEPVEDLVEVAFIPAWPAESGNLTFTGEGRLNVTGNTRFTIPPSA